MSSKTPKAVVMWMDQLKEIYQEKEELMYVTEKVILSNNKEVTVFSTKIINKVKHEVGNKIEGPELEVRKNELRELESLRVSQLEDILENDAFKIAML